MLRLLLSGLAAVALLSEVAFAQPAADAARIEVIPNIGHANQLYSVAYSPDGRTLISAGEDGTARLWEKSSGRLLRIFQQSSAIHAAAFLPDGGTIVFAGASSEIKIVNSATGEVLRTFAARADGSVATLAVSPDGRAVAAASSNTIKLWDVSTGRLLKTFQGHKMDVNAIAFSSDGRIVVSGSGDKTVKLWDVATGRALRTLTGHTDLVNAVAFSADGKMVVSGGPDKTLKLWDVATGRQIRTLLGHGDYVFAARFSPDGRTLASGGDDKRIIIWDVRTGNQLRTLRGHLGRVSALDFSSDGRAILSVSYDASVRLWDVGTGSELRWYGGSVPPITGFTMSGDASLIATQGRGVSLWDAAEARLSHNFNIDRSSVRAIAFSPDARTIAAAQPDGSLRLWDVSTLAEKNRFTSLGPTSALGAGVTFSSDGRMIVSSNKNVVIARDAATGSELRRFSVDGFEREFVKVAISPDGRLIAGSSAGTVVVWDAASGKTLDSLANGSFVRALAFSPDSRLLVVGTLLQSVPKLWDLSGGQGRERAMSGLNVPNKGVGAATFSRDGRYVVAGGDDSTVRIYEAGTGREVRTLTGHRGEVSGVAITPDGQTIYSGARDRTLRRWSFGGELLITSIVAGDGEWVRITPEGFFDASEKGGNLLTVVRSVTPISIDQFYQSLYRPDLVREKLAGDPRGLVRAAAAQLDLSKVVASGGAPDVSLTLPGRVAGSGSVDGDSVTAEAEITDRGGGIGKVEWRVNGVTLGVEERGVRRTDQGTEKSIKVSRTLGLTPGENRIAVSAFNEAGLIASVPAEIVVNSVQQSAATPRLHVLAVGVNDYWDSALRLSYAAVDARALSDGLKQAGGKLYERVETATVLDSEATADKLDGVFNELAKQVRPQDVFVFFLAGHGKTVDARFYFLPQDFRYAGEESVTRKGIGQDRLQAWFSRIKAQKSVLLFDACESGSLIGDRFAMRGIAEKTALDRMTRAMGRTVLTATTDSKPAIEGYRGHGAFTYTLLAGFDAADSNNDGVIDVAELAQYVDRRLPDLTHDAFNLRQIPQMSIVGSNFPLASKVSLLPADGSASPPAAAVIPTKPTHVVIAPAQVRQSPAETGATITELSAGSQVTIVQREGNWIAIARDGKKLGYVEEKALAALH